MEAFIGFREIIPALLIYIFLQIHPISAQLNLHVCSNTNGNYTQNSTFHSNLNSILTSLSSNINTTNGFYHGSAGNGVDQVNALGYCRGDIYDIGTCRACLNDAARNLTSLFCPNQKEAILWLEFCMFRYSNNPILGVMSFNPAYKLFNTNNASNVNLYSSQLISLADNLTRVAYNGSPRKNAGIKSIDPNATTVYGFMECTPDLTPGDCKACLTSIANDLSSCCYTHTGAQLLTPSCIFRFEIYSFLKDISNQPPPPPLLLPLPPSPTPLTPLLSPAARPPPPPTTDHKGRSNAAVISVISVIVSLFVVTLIAACVFLYKKRRQKTSRSGHTLDEEDEELRAISDTETRQYDFALIRAVTNDFSTANLLGDGGFGAVYKGVLSNGKEIAVKRLSKSSGQGEKEFRNEVILLAKLQHNCLVRLLGFCLEQTERLLIYEFMPNGSLDNLLFNSDRSKLDWGERYKIINNVAKGLLYLHEDSRLKIIHRDLKASNILLDEEMNAKISDFGTARLFVLDKSEGNTTKIVGTMGYMAPEYAIHGFFSVKSDVYSYGVLLLEIVSGKKNRYSPNEDSYEGLLSYAYKTWKNGRASDLIDPMLTAHSYSQEIIIRCIHIALLCVQENVARRPTMATVVLMLQSLTMTMPLPSEPGFFNNSNTWFSDIHESTSSSNQTRSRSRSISVHGGTHNDTSLNFDETDSYLYPR